MINPQLLDYIKQQLQLGFNTDQIKNSLRAIGWQDAPINDAFNHIFNSAPKNYQPQPVMSSLASLPPPSAIFAEAKSLYIQRMGTFLGIMAIPMLIMTGLIIMLKNSGIIGYMPSVSFGRLTTGQPSLTIVSLVVVLLITGIAHALGQLALLYAIKDSYEKIGIMESYRRGSQKILPFILISIIVAVITVGGYFLFLIPGIIFSVWFSFATIILVAEGTQGMDALLKSKEYVKGKFGNVFWSLFYIGVISTLISIGIKIFTTLIIYLTSFLNIPFIKEIGQAIIGIFLTPLVLSYLYLLYSKLKAVKGDAAYAPSQGKKTGFFIIGAIALVAIPAFFILPRFALNSQRENARDSKRRADIRYIRTSIEVYYDDNNRLPTSLNQLQGRYGSIPKDPTTNLPYKYELQGQSDFKVCAQLETGKEDCVSLR